MKSNKRISYCILFISCVVLLFSLFINLEGEELLEIVIRRIFIVSSMLFSICGIVYGGLSTFKDKRNIFPLILNILAFITSIIIMVYNDIGISVILDNIILSGIIVFLVVFTLAHLIKRVEEKESLIKDNKKEESIIDKITYGAFNLFLLLILLVIIIYVIYGL